MIKPLPFEIIDRATKGDVHAFRKIVEHHQSFAYAVAYRFVGNRFDAEDITQEAFVRLWKNLSRYRREVKLSTWLYTIVSHLSLDFLRAPRNRVQRNSLDHAEKAPAHVTPYSLIVAHETRLQIEQAADQLPPLQKAVFVLRDLEELSVAETCEILSLSADQVKSNLFHARQKMAAQLGDPSE